MAEPGPTPSSDALGKLSPGELIELLARLEPGAEELQRIDIDRIGRAIDPKRLRREEFTRLLAEVDRLAGGSAVDLGAMGAETFARLIGRASRDQLRDVLGRPELRARILGEVFRRIPEYLRADRARSTRGAVHWRFIGDAGDYDRYEIVLAGGECTAGAGHSDDDPRVTITTAAYDFLRLITSNASAPALLLTGKLKVRGDLAFAAGLLGLFHFPSAR